MRYGWWLVGTPWHTSLSPIDPGFLKDNECVLQKDAPGTHNSKSSVTECSCKEWNCINGSAEMSALAELWVGKSAVCSSN